MYFCQLNGREPTDNLLEMVCISGESFFIYLYLDICRKIFISLGEIFSVCCATVGFDVLSGVRSAQSSLSNSEQSIIPAETYLFIWK